MCYSLEGQLCGNVRHVRPDLLDQERRFEDLAQSAKAKKEELSRMRSHYAELREQLARERDRIIEHLIPKRYTLHGSAQVFPVGAEIRV